eukprot:c2996_g1_i1 orf=122-907(-)
MANSHTLSPILQLVITLFSFSCACGAGLYVHPLLLPILMDSVPWLGSAVQVRLSPLFLFILLNVLVVALYATSRMMPQGGKRQQGDDDESINLEMQEASYLDDSPNKTSGDMLAASPVKMFDDILCSDMLPTSADEMSNGILSDDDDVERVDAGLKTQRKSANSRNRRLGRSRSDANTALAMGGKSTTGLRPVVPHLKKTGTFESALLRRRVKPVVVVDDPPEEGQAVEEEVDKKAEEFIGRFYQRVKLQHLDSIRRATTP